MAGVVQAASFEPRVEALFRPLLGEWMALSPDGQRIAFTSEEDGALAIVIMDLESLRTKRAVRVQPETEGNPAEARAPVRLRFLRWATPQRIVFAPEERVIPLPPVADKEGRLTPNPDGPTIIAPIMAADADGRHRGTLIDARHFMETPAEARRTLADFLRTPKELAATRSEAVGWRMPHLDVLGFLPDDREQIVIGTRGAHSMPEQHLVDIRTATVRRFGGNWPMPAREPEVYDWYRLRVVGERRPAARPTTVWRDDDLARVQRELEAKFPRRIVEIVDWSETRARTLFQVSGGSDPGRVFVYQRSEDLVLEVFRRAPWLTSAKLNETRFFEFPFRGTTRVSGYLTWPKQPRSNPPPLVVTLPSQVDSRALAAFDPEAQALAEMGFAVVRLSAPLSGGVSVNHVHGALDGLARQYPDRPFDRSRVVVWGRGWTGNLALQTLQLEPAAFRAAVAIDPRASEIARRGDAPQPPVLLVTEAAQGAESARSLREVQSELQALGRIAEFLEPDANLPAGSAASRAATYQRVERFLQQHLFEAAANGAAAKEVE